MSTDSERTATDMSHTMDTVDTEPEKAAGEEEKENESGEERKEVIEKDETLQTEGKSETDKQKDHKKEKRKDVWAAYAFEIDDDLIGGRWTTKNGKLHGVVVYLDNVAYCYEGKQVSGEVEYAYRELGFQKHFKRGESNFDKLKSLLTEERGVRFEFTSEVQLDDIVYGETRVSRLVSTDDKLYKVCGQLRASTEGVDDARELLESIGNRNAITAITPPGLLSGVDITFTKMSYEDAMEALSGL